MIAAICFGLFVIILVAMCTPLFSEGTMSKKAGGKYLGAIIVLLVVFSFVFEPKSFIRWDLLQHFYLVDKMRYGGLDFALNESQYSGLFVYNYFAYFISLLPEKLQNLLTTIPLIIDLLIVRYIYKKTFEKYLTDASGKARVLSILSR